MLGSVVGGRYLVEEELGSGSMGRVYRARHLKISRPVAIKVIHRELLTNPALVARFGREATAAARVRHPNLVGVLDIGATIDGLHYIVLELAPGRSLTALLREAAPLDRACIIDLVRQLLSGLHHAHAANLIHRDLKPDNVLVEVTPGGKQIARIVDFGIAMLRDDTGPRLTEANTVVGTPHYMSPEHATNRVLDHRTDLFALGVIVYEMLTGTLPFSGTGQEVAFANVHFDPPPTPHVDPALDAFARKLMARKLDTRFATAREALAALDEIADEPARPPRAHPITQPPLSSRPIIFVPSSSSRAQREPSPPTPRRDRLWMIAGSALVVVASLVLLGIGFGTRRAPIDNDPPMVVMQAQLDVPMHEATVAHDPQPPPPPPMLSPPPAPTPRPAVVERPVIERPVVAAPAVVDVPPAVVALDPNAAIAARYAAVGKRLHDRPLADPMWQRYRRIQLSEAMTNAAARHVANEILDGIERELTAR